MELLNYTPHLFFLIKIINEIITYPIPTIIALGFLTLFIYYKKHITNVFRQRIMYNLLNEEIVSRGLFLYRMCTNLIKNNDNDISIVGNTLSLFYKYNNTNYQLFLPYSKINRKYTYYSVLNDQRTKISHPPGVKFLLTAKDLLCDRIDVYDLSDELVASFEENKEIIF